MKHIHIMALVIIGALIAFIVSTSANYTSYETFATAKASNGKNFKVVGKLVKDNPSKPMSYNPKIDANLFSFFVVDGNGHEEKVVYRNAPPQDFDKSEQIVLTGKMKKGDFHASEIQLKCPSKYKEEGTEMKAFKAVEG